VSLYSKCVKLSPTVGYRWRFVLPRLKSHFPFLEIKLLLLMLLYIFCKSVPSFFKLIIFKLCFWFFFNLHVSLFPCLLFTVVSYLGIMTVDVLNLQDYILNSVFSATDLLFLVTYPGVRINYTVLEVLMWKFPSYFVIYQLVLIIEVGCIKFCFLEPIFNAVQNSHYT
jgi:hypothetical protein